MYPLNNTRDAAQRNGIIRCLSMLMAVTVITFVLLLR
jgi:hypothetical protein